MSYIAFNLDQRDFIYSSTGKLLKFLSRLTCSLESLEIMNSETIGVRSFCYTAITHGCCFAAGEG